MNFEYLSGKIQLNILVDATRQAEVSLFDNYEVALTAQRGNEFLWH